MKRGKKKHAWQKEKYIRDLRGNGNAKKPSLSHICKGLLLKKETDVSNPLHYKLWQPGAFKEQVIPKAV